MEPETWQLRVWHPGFQSRILRSQLHQAVHRWGQCRHLGDAAMFYYLFHPYLRWLRGRQDFGIDRDGLLSQPLVRHTLNFAAPASEALLPSARRPT